jgi:hypothetical protein
MDTATQNCWAFRVDRRYVADLDAELQGWTTTARVGLGPQTKPKGDGGGRRRGSKPADVQPGQKGDYILI